MSTIALKIKNYASRVDIVNNNNMARRMLGMLIFALGALSLLYVVLLGNMVVNIVQRRALEMQARTLTNEVADLELSYLSVSNKVDLSLSHSLGFQETPARFAVRKALGSIKVAPNEL